jgi:hypothetical protein
MSVPITNAAAKDSKVSDTVVRIPWRKRSRLSKTTSIDLSPCGQRVVDVVLAPAVVVVAAAVVAVPVPP